MKRPRAGWLAICAACVCWSVACGTGEWPDGARDAVEDRDCIGKCEAIELLIWEYREGDRGDGEIRRNQFIFVWMDFGVSFYAATYFKTDEREWLPLWLDSTVTSMSFAEPPTIDEVVQVLMTWTFDQVDERGTLLDGRIYYETWERTIGERPDIAYPNEPE